METESSTFSIFQYINLSNRIFKLHQSGKNVSEGQCYYILKQFESISITSEKIVAQIIKKDSQLINIKYQLYCLFGSESRATFQSTIRPSDKQKSPPEISYPIADTTLNSLIKRIDAINSQARYIGVELGLVQQNCKISSDLIQRLQCFPLRTMFKMLAKEKGSILKKTKFIVSVKNLLVLQEMIMLLFGQIYAQMKKLCKQLSKPEQMQEQNYSAKNSQISKKSSLSSCVQEYLEKYQSTASFQTPKRIKQNIIIPQDFNFTSNRLSNQMDLSKKHRKKQIRVTGVCCFNI